MSLAITPTGMTIETFDEIFADLVAGYQAAYGIDIDTDAESPDGQRIGIESKLRLDLQSIALQIFNGMDPQTSTGSHFNSLLKLVGTSLTPGTRSTVDVVVTADRDLTINSGWLVTDDLSQQWELTQDTPILTGNSTVTLRAKNFGPVSASAGTVTTQATIVIGVTGVTNPIPASPGKDEETVPEARIRRKKLLTLPANSSVGGLYSAVSLVPGVTDLVIYENAADTLDAVKNMVAHSIWVVAEGGAVADIVQSMAIGKNAGTSKKGLVSGVYQEHVPRAGGGFFIINHIMEFDRPTYTPLHVTLTVESRDGSGIDTAAIEAAIADREFRIAENAVASEFYGLAYSAGSNFICTLMQISRDGVTYTDGREIAGFDEVFTMDIANIDVTTV